MIRIPNKMPNSIDSHSFIFDRSLLSLRNSVEFPAIRKRCSKVFNFSCIYFLNGIFGGWLTPLLLPRAADTAHQSFETTSCCCTAVFILVSMASHPQGKCPRKQHRTDRQPIFEWICFVLLPFSSPTIQV